MQLNLKLVFACLAIAALLSHSTATVGQEPSLRHTPIVRAVKLAAPAVVNISGQKSSDFKHVGSTRDRSPVNGMGTGVIFESSGYVLTNYHVIAGIEHIHVKLNPLSTNLPRNLTARLIGFDRSIDLAVIKIDSQQSFPVIPLSTSADLLLGESVIAIGNAYGYEDTITRGIISSLHRRVQVNDNQFYDDLIQTDASINPGNSGGPLINILGEAIGINVAVRIGAQSIGFAIPMDRAMQVASSILREDAEKRIQIGLRVNTIIQDRKPTVTVQHVSRNSLASSAGLKAEDVIVAIDNKPIGWAVNLYHFVIQASDGDSLNLTISRDGEQHHLSMDLIGIEKEEGLITSRAWDEIGIRVKPVDFKSLGKKSTYTGGLKITQVRSSSPATRQGLKTGDILLGMHKWETVNYENLSYVLNSEVFIAKKPVVFYIYRDQEFLYGELFQP